MPGFADWLTRERVEENSAALTEADKAMLAALDPPGWWRDEETAAQLQDPVMRAAAWYYLRARNERGTAGRCGGALPSRQWRAARAHQLARRHFGRAMAQAHGLMVNYLYELDDIEKNHEAYAEDRTVVASRAVQRLLRPPLELVPIAG